MELLFSYGTLQNTNVQLETFGRQLIGSKDKLPGYKLSQLEIVDEKVLAVSQQKFHPIVIKTDNPADKVAGSVLEITKEELAQADAYEVEDYKRVLATCESGAKAWVYVAR